MFSDAGRRPASVCEKRLCDNHTGNIRRRRREEEEARRDMNEISPLRQCVAPHPTHSHWTPKEPELLHPNTSRGVTLPAHNYVNIQQFPNKYINKGRKEQRRWHEKYPDRLQSCAPLRTKPRTEVLTRHRASSLKQVDHSEEETLRHSHLDGLRGLAFHLVRYGGGLVHLGTPTQTVLLSKWDTKKKKKESQSGEN